MKILKSVLSLGLAFIALNVSATKKSDVDVQKFAELQTSNIMSNVKNVTSDQENKIMQIEQESDNALLDARNSDDSDALKSRIRQNRDSKIQAILTADQFAQYQKMLAAQVALRTAK
ncbi:MAG TPA: hypothetical protein VN922_16840 [Bacteroidia bacterium]|nr:hypothetical protein [Bacteroidia bacterium]